MAQPATPGCIKGCIIVPIITILVLVIVVVGGAFIVLNMTPADLGIADVELFEGETFETLGLANVKFKEIPNFIKDLTNVDESKIVTNTYTEEDKTSANDNISGSNIKKKEDNTIDYSSIATDKIIYPTKQNVEYNDTTLAYIFNQMLADGAESSDDAVEFLKELNANINEVTIAPGENGYSLRIVASISLQSITGEVKAALKEAGIDGLISLPEKVFLVSYSDMEINAEGTLVTTSKSLKINDSDNPISQAIMKVLAKKANETAQEEGQQIDTSSNVVNDEIGKAFVSIVSNLGKPVELKEGAIVVETYTE